MLNAFFITCIAGFSTLLGALPIFFKFKESRVDKFIAFSLSFSACIMIGLSVTDLIPVSFFNILFTLGDRGQFLIFFIIILGYCIMKFCTKKIKSDNDLLSVGILSLIALFVHNLPEGVAVFASSSKNPVLGIKLAFAIMMHNIPEGILIAVPIYYSTKSKLAALGCTLIAAIAEPMGAIVTYLFFMDLVSYLFIDSVLLFVGVIMIILANNEIYPKAKNYNYPNVLLCGLLTGLIIIILNLFLTYNFI